MTDRVFIARRPDGSMSPIWWRREPDQSRLGKKVDYRPFVREELADGLFEALQALASTPGVQIGMSAYAAPKTVEKVNAALAAYSKSRSRPPEP